MKMSDIAVTGIGVIASMGIGREAFWESCRQARTGLKKITAFDTSPFAANVAGWVDGFEPREFMPPRAYRRMSRISRLAVCSSVEALHDSGLNFENQKKERIAVILGTAYGSSSHVDEFFTSLLKDGPRGAQPFLFPETVPNAPASHIAMFHGITGPNTTFCQNEISAENAMLYARNLLLQGLVDVALAGGADELSAMQYSCYHALGVLNKIKVTHDEPATPKPGGGLVLGEGAGTLVMERLDSAVRRGAKIYGILKSGALTGGPAPMGHYEAEGGQMGRAMSLAIKQAHLCPDDIDHIDVSANFSAELDRIEHHQLKIIFSKRASDLAVTPLKYLMGDFGGAGIIRAAAILLSLYRRQPLPVLNAEVLTAGPQDVLKWAIPSRRNIQTALMTSSSFGGGSCSLIFTGHSKIESL
ncbi:MAG: beta-ketoacyl synthase N-terminal-like domain-containing protein [Pseudomonadota bacterium]